MWRHSIIYHYAPKLHNKYVVFTDKTDAIHKKSKKQRLFLSKIKCIREKMLNFVV